MDAKIKIKKRINGESYFVLCAPNGEVILSSENYLSEPALKNGIRAVQKFSPRADSFDRKLSINGKHYFYLKASNGHVIGTGEMFESSSGLENAVAAVMKYGATDLIED